MDRLQSTTQPTTTLRALGEIQLPDQVIREVTFAFAGLSNGGSHGVFLLDGEDSRDEGLPGPDPRISE